MVSMRTLLFFTVFLTLHAQDFSDIMIEKVAANSRFTEGPVWSREGYLLFSDVPNNRVIRFTPGHGIATFRDNTNGANGNAYDKDGRLYTCESRTRRVMRQEKDGAWKVLAENYQGKRFNAPNDIIVRRDGHVWFTDPAFGEQADHVELGFYGIYHINPKGEVDLVAKPKGRPNGITLSPNGRILYVANSDERSVYAYDVDGQGRATNERVLIKDIEGPPDGLRVDEKGNIYVTCTHLMIYSALGKLIKKIEMPETPSNCAFGDPDFQTLYVTARTSVYRIRLNVKGAVQY
jgi:gluconolactonase